MKSLSLKDWKEEWRPPKGAEFLSSSEAATALGICKTTLYRWEAQGKIHCFRTPGNQRRIAVSEVIRLRLLMQSKNQPPPLKSPVPLTEEFPVPRHDRRVLKNQCKVLQVLLRATRPEVVLGLLPMLIQVLGEAIEPHTQKKSLLKAWATFQSEILALVAQLDQQFDEELLKKTAPAQMPTYRRKTITAFDHARATGAQVFQDLIKASEDQRLDPEERKRAHGLVDRILEPYRRLTTYLALFPPGTVEHDVSLLLLTKHPADYNRMRQRWSVRLLSQVCQDHLGTKSASKSQVGRFYKRLAWHKPVNRKLLSPDPAFGEKMKQIGRTLATLEPEDTWVVGDELTFTSTKTREQSAPTHAPEGLRLHLQAEKVYCYKPNHAIEISGLYDPSTRQLETKQLPSTNFQGYLPTLAKLARRFLKRKTGRLIIGLDNGPIHRTGILQKELRALLKKKANELAFSFFPLIPPIVTQLKGSGNNSSTASLERAIRPRNCRPC